MKTLKSKYCIAIVLLCWSTIACFSQARPSIEIERIKTDIIDSDLNVIPIKIIKKASDSKFTIFYLDNLCISHLAFRDYFTESFMKSSMLAIYQFDDAKWALKKVTPYYYSISVVDKNGKIFLSVNEFCEPNASCNSFFEFSKLDSEMEMIPLEQINGFDKSYYLLRLLILNRNEEVLKFKGDTISQNIELSNIRFDDKNLLFLKTTTTNILLEVVSDSLVTRTSSIKINHKTKK